MGAAALATDLDPITEAQRPYAGRARPTTAQDFFALARWWDLEADRGYPTAARSRWYAANMLRAAERRMGSGTPAPWTPGIDTTAPQCRICAGPSDGPLACGCAP